jgi:hypothetical protein
MDNRRFWVCILGGIISAGICLTGREIIFGFPEIHWFDIAATVANRILIGFTIGISAWKIPHLLHGALIGLIFSLSVSIGFLPTDLITFGLYTTAGVLYGVLIEWLATNIFKLPMG